MASNLDRYRLYIDESGDHVFHDPKTLEQPAHRFLALVGCSFARSAYGSFPKSLELLKQKHLPHDPDEPLVLHRSDILGTKGPFWRLRDAAARVAFDEDLLALIATSDYSVTLVVIDKLLLKLNYPNPFHPYHMALDILLQRYCIELSRASRQGDVMAESRGGREDRLLANAYSHIHTHGDMHHRAGFYQQCLTSCELKLKPKSANVAGLQLADLIAHPLKQAFLAERGLVRPTGGAFAPKIAEAAARKYNRNLRTGELDGYGRVLFPK